MNKTWTIIVEAMGAVLLVLLIGFGEHINGKIDDMQKDITQIRVDISALKAIHDMTEAADAPATNHLPDNYVLVTIP